MNVKLRGDSFYRGDDAFRPFTSLGCLRAIISAPFLAFTTTAAEEIWRTIVAMRHMEECTLRPIERAFVTV